MKAFGFTLIELSIGLFLSSLIGTALYNAFFVTNRVVSIADNFISIDLRASLVENQLEKDIAGVFIPEQAAPNKPQADKSKNEKKDEQEKETPEKKNEGEQKEKEQKPLEKIFYTQNGQNDLLQMITFITNNPVKVYEKATNVTPKPRIVRVVYRLIADQENPESFKLMRQESSELDLKAFELNAAKPIRGFEIAADIKSITCEYIFPVKKEEQQANKQGEKNKKEEKPKPEYKTIKNWDSDSQKDENKEQPKIPEFIRCTCNFWDNKRNEEQFVFDFQISTFVAQTAPKKQEKAVIPPKKNEPAEGSNPANQASQPAAAKPSANQKEQAPPILTG